MKKYISFFSLFCLLLSLQSFLLQAQSADVGIGQWRVHLPYNQCKSVAENGNKVYCVGLSGLFSYTKEDGSVKRISRINGLSDFGIDQIRYSTAVGVLVIAYENSNIDLLFDNGSIVNLADIKRKNLNGNTAINDIYFKDHLAYLACGFGIVVLDLDRQEVKDTYYIGANGTSINVNSVADDNTYFYASTDTGIYKALVNDPFLYLYSEWSTDTTLPNPKGKFGSVSLFNNKIYCVDNDTSVYSHDNSGWSRFNYFNYGIRLQTHGNYLMISSDFGVSAYAAGGNQIYSSDDNAYPHASPQEAIVDANNVMYIADANNGLVRDQQGTYTTIYPNGPSSTASVAMCSLNDDVWVASGAISSVTAHTPTISRNGIYHYTNNTWTSFNKLNTTLFDTINFPDVMDIKCDPNDSKHVFVAGWGGGVLEFRDNAFVGRYDSTNSTLKGLAIPGYSPMLIGGLNFDQNNNLWVLNSANSNPINALLADGSWKSFALPFAIAQAYNSNILIDNNNYKWFIINGIGIGVFYENDINNLSDDQFKVLTTGTGLGNLPTSQIYSMVMDQDGTIWIGSDNGVAAFYSSQTVFNPTGFDAQQVLIQQGTHTQILLQSQSVTAIAVDGANRKWFGTSSGGVFLTSSDGTNQLLNFNTDNSPLLSNNITSIAIDQSTGEVFFGTDQGICSYRGSATEGGDACDNYYVFPNPVKHDYNGLIAVRGLVANAHVKITDVSGNVVYEATANGGQATWGGTNYQGVRAHTGVYLVYVSNDDGSATCITKFLMVN